MSEETKTGKGKVIGSLMGLVAVGAACVAIGWVAREIVPKKPKPPSPQLEAMKAMAMAPQTVSVQKAELRKYEKPMKYLAHAEARQEVNLVSQVDGFIDEVCFQEGAMVKAGDTLYKLDADRYLGILEQRKADLVAAKAECERAEKYDKRMQAAAAKDAAHKVVSEAACDDAAAAAEKARAAVKQAEANLKVAEYDLSRAKVVAPIDGQIGKTFVHKGDFVSPAKGPLACITQIDPIRVTYPMTDRDYNEWVRAHNEGRERELTYKLYLPGVKEKSVEYPYEGTRDFDDNKMSRETASITRRLLFKNPEGLLKPNSFMNLEVDYKDAKDVPHVPQQAIVDQGEGVKGVWIFNEADASVHWREVTVGQVSRGWAPLLKGVQAGESVVISGMPKLKDGAQVKVLPAQPNDDLQPGYVSPIAETKKTAEAEKTAGEDAK